MPATIRNQKIPIQSQPFSRSCHRRPSRWRRHSTPLKIDILNFGGGSLVQRRGNGSTPIRPGATGRSAGPDFWTLLFTAIPGALNQYPGCNISGSQLAGGNHDNHFPDGGRRAGSGGARAKARNFARPRPHLPDAGGAAASRRHPLHLLRSYRPKEFFGFDMIVLATDSFFMAMFFFLSGLFVWPGIARKGPLNYLSDRLLRLGLPFAICAFTVIPLAYYAISLRQHPEVGFSEFWWNTITRARGRADRSGSFGSCSASIWLLASCIGCHPTCSIRSIACRCMAAVGPPCSLRSCLPSPLRSTFPG